MNRKTKILCLSYGAAAVFTAAGLVFSTAGAAEGYRLSQGYEYRRAMAQLVSSVSDMDAALEKGGAATGAGMTGKVCAQLMSGAQSASTALSILPLDTYALEELAGFLSQMEEYARVKGSLACAGTGFDEADREMSAELQQVTGALVPVLEELYTQVSEGALEIRGLIDEDGRITDEPDSYLEDEILDLLEDFPETPELVYAGKLSADYDDSYRFLQGTSTVTEQVAKETAEALAGVELEFQGLSAGEVPSYYFSGDTENGTVTVAVTTQGGMPLWYLLDYAGGEVKISEWEAKRNLQAFLAKAGYTDLKEVDARQENGLLKVRYVYADGADHGAESIRTAVAMDTGIVVSMDAADYLHHRSNEAHEAVPKLTAEAARKTAVPEELSVEEHSLTWFTGDTGMTSLCWRFLCTDDQGEKIVVYADTDSGNQVEIVLQREDVSEM